MNMLTHTYPHKPLRKIKVTICNHQADSPLYVSSDVWFGDWRFRKRMVIHDTECPYWDQVSLNNTNQLPNKLNPVQECWSSVPWELSYVLTQVQVRQKDNASHVRPGWDSNPWPPDHDTRFHACARDACSNHWVIRELYPVMVCLSMLLHGYSSDFSARK